MATIPQQGSQPDGQRSGRQLLAFGFFWLAVPLLLLAAWLAANRIDRLLHWSKADAEIRRTDVYTMNLRETRKRSWSADVTIRYVANGQPVETTVGRGFQTGIRPWMELWTRQYPIGSHKQILFDPTSPLDADLDGEWTLASFASPVGYALAAAILFWAWRRLRVAIPSV